MTQRAALLNNEAVRRSHCTSPLRTPVPQAAWAPGKPWGCSQEPIFAWNGTWHSGIWTWASGRCFLRNKLSELQGKQSLHLMPMMKSKPSSKNWYLRKSYLPPRARRHPVPRSLMQSVLILMNVIFVFA